MLPDRVSNPGPLTYESGALPIVLLWNATILSLFVPSCAKTLELELSSVGPVR